MPRVKIFAGKAAASYRRAKLIIKLIHDVAHVINNDPAVRGLLKVVFLPDYNVSLAEAIIPAADLSEQISTAGMEASGTGNMKLALNGALTIGTLDGANIEIRERVGADNIFIFGLTAEEVVERRRRGPGARETIAGLPVLQEVLDAVAYGVFSPDEPQRYRELVDELTGNDHFMVTADFDAYADAQGEVAARWRDRRAWWRASVLNTANVGWFSSDRTIREYADGDLERGAARRVGIAPPHPSRQHRGDAGGEGDGSDRPQRKAGTRAGCAPVDIGVAGGRIAAIETALQADGPVFDAGGCLVCGGLVETHIHLDKSNIIDRCAPETGRQANSMQRVAAVKQTFTVEDVYAARRSHAGEVHQARRHADAHASGTGRRRGDAQLRGDRGAAARLRLGDRRRGLRVPAGGADQQSRAPMRCWWRG